MKKSLFYSSLSMLFLSAVLAGMNACSKKSEATPAAETPQQPNMLKNAQKGKPFSAGYIADFTLAEKDKQVVLMAANNITGMVYAIDLEDNDASKASVNTITGPVANFGTQLATTLGASPSQLSILNMEVNPVTKSIYLLMFNTSMNTSAIVKVTNQGTVFKVLDFSNVSYVAIPFSTIGENVNDMTWGNNTLFVSYSHPSTLAGKVATAQGPFEANKAMTNRATTVFKTNWGSNYFTNAPLESMCYAEIGGKGRLMGVTVCAPGYSFETSEIASGSGLLQVKEYFNLNTGSAYKVFPVVNNNTTYLIEHHFDGRITRVGQKYIDGSQTQFNANAKYLLQSDAITRTLGLNDADVKIVANPGTYLVSAKHSDTQLMVFSGTGALSLLSF